jgi:hypothetical protein
MKLIVDTSPPSVESLRLLYDTFWGKRDIETDFITTIKTNDHPHVNQSLLPANVPKKRKGKGKKKNSKVNKNKAAAATNVHSDKIDRSGWRVLDLGIDGVFPWEPPCKTSRIVVRNEFVKMYKEAQNGSKADERGRTITGHPGMGMSSASYRRSLVLLFYL